MNIRYLLDLGKTEWQVIGYSIITGFFLFITKRKASYFFRKSNQKKQDGQDRLVFESARNIMDFFIVNQYTADQKINNKEQNG